MRVARGVRAAHEQRKYTLSADIGGGGDQLPGDEVYRVGATGFGLVDPVGLDSAVLVVLHRDPGALEILRAERVVADVHFLTRGLDPGHLRLRDLAQILGLRLIRLHVLVGRGLELDTRVLVEVGRGVRRIPETLAEALLERFGGILLRVVPGHGQNSNAEILAETSVAC